PARGIGVAAGANALTPRGQTSPRYLGPRSATTAPAIVTPQGPRVEVAASASVLGARRLAWPREVAPTALAARPARVPVGEAALLSPPPAPAAPIPSRHAGACHDPTPQPRRPHPPLPPAAPR